MIITYIAITFVTASTRSVTGAKHKLPKSSGVSSRVELRGIVTQHVFIYGPVKYCQQKKGRPDSERRHFERVVIVQQFLLQRPPNHNLSL